MAVSAMVAVVTLGSTLGYCTFVVWYGPEVLLATIVLLIAASVLTGPILLAASVYEKLMRKNNHAK